jgi:hypothetical protein
MMISVPATVRDGQIVPLAPIPWPDGASIELRLAGTEAMESDEIAGMTDEEQVGSPEAIDRWQAAVRSLPKTDWTDADQEEWDRHRRERKDWELAHQAERERKLEQPE